MSHRVTLLNKVENKTAKVGVLGLGYVGIPLVLAISQVGLPVIGFDVDKDRVKGLNSGESPIKHFPHDMIAGLIEREFMATDDFRHIEECDFLLICVPTPLNKYREPDLRSVITTMDTIQPYLRKGQMLALESTTWPGTTEEVLKPYATERGFKIGDDFFLVYSPEREDPGNPDFETQTIPKIIGSDTRSCLEVAQALYGRFIDKIVPVSSTKTAEMVKLVENIHRSVNIGLMNELKKVAQAMKLDIFEIIDAAATKPFGFTPYYPGPGIGGHCIPIDPFYLTWKARQFGLHTHFIELAGEINAAMPQFVVDKTIKTLNEHGKSLKGAKILCLGISYKRNVEDMRGSPSVMVMELLRDWGGDVAYSDMHVPSFPRMREHYFNLSSVELTPENIAFYDAVIILTDHSDFDYDLISKNANIIIDSRGRFRKGSELEKNAKATIVYA